MAEDFVSGYLTTLTIDSVDHSIWSNTASLDMSEGTMRKAVFGSQFPTVIRTQSEGTLRSTGHISTAAAAALDAARLSATAIAYELALGPGSSVDAGKYGGSLLVTRLTIDADAEGQVSFSLEGQCTDSPVYTAPTP